MEPDFKILEVLPGREWARLERLSSLAPGFPAERAYATGAHTDPDARAAFGSAMPSARDAVLHFGRNWEAGRGTPVLLVHGATVDASCWRRPYGHTGRGVATALEARGHAVFALTFAHKHGDNLSWAALLAHAIARVKQVTGASQVDLVTHSKGTVAARVLLSGFTRAWMPAYRGDVRRVLMLGGPQLGLDYVFRHPLHSLGLAAPMGRRFDAPMAWTRARAWGLWMDTSERSILGDHGDLYPGQRQMLSRWDHRYALPRLEPDWYTTYYGGRGFVSESPGIDKAIAQGDHFMACLRELPLDDAVELALLAGTRANRGGYLNELTGPSDGLVFVESALHHADMTRGGAALLAADALPLNHGELIYDDQALAWIIRTLETPSPARCNRPVTTGT